MYELSRVRLHSAGPKGARYQDVVLDLRGVGAPIVRPVQGALIDDLDEQASGQDLVPRRPSPASVVFLENGGGKSVLMKLIFSVMLPGRRQVVGTTSTRVLDKFVLASDVAHVVLEWHHVRTGQRIVVGKVSAWRDHVVSADPERLQEAWYAFRPTSTFNLDTLPFTDGGRLVSMSGFHDRLTEASRTEPEIQSVWERGRTVWTEKLTALGLDPELFAYQRRMNAGEGEAADAFSFKSDEAFIDWLLTAVTREDDPRALGEVVTRYAEKLSKREGLIAERDFVAGALGRISPLAAAARDVLAAIEINAETRRDAELFAAALSARHLMETKNLAQLDSELTELEEPLRDADQERRRLNSIHLELRRLVAELRWREAEQRRDRLDVDLTEAAALVEAWQATDRILRYRGAQDKAQRLRRVVTEQEQQAAPALADRDLAAGRLARALLATTETAEEQAEELDQVVTDLKSAMSQADEDAHAATRDASEARGRAGEAEGRVAEVQTMVQDAVRDCILSDGENVALAAERSRQDAAAASTQLARALGQLDDVAEERKGLQRDLKIQRTARSAKADQEAKAARAYTAADHMASTLATEERLAALLGVEQIVLDTDAPQLLELLTAAISDAEREQGHLRTVGEEDGRVLDALGTGGLLPPRSDVSDALAALEEANITAWPGWHYLASVPEQDQDALIGAYPYLIDGIVLNRSDQMEVAERILTDARLLPRSIVVVGATATLAGRRAPAPYGLGVLVPPNPAMYDEQRAEEERQAILTRTEQRETRLATLADRLTADRRVHQRLTEWRAAYPPGALEELREEAETRARELADADVHLEELDKQVESLNELDEELRKALPGLRADESTAVTRADRLAGVATQTERIPRWQQAAKAAHEAAVVHDREAGQCRQRAATLRQQVEETIRAADDQRRNAAIARDELRTVSGGATVRSTDPVPDEPVETLREAYATAAEAYARVRVGDDLRTDLASADQTEAETWVSVENLKRPVRELAEHLLRTPDGSGPAGRSAATARAQRQMADIDRQCKEQNQLVGQLKHDFESRPRQDVTLEPYGRPSDISSGKELVIRAHGDWERARDAWDRLNARKESLDNRITDTRVIVNGFQAHLDGLGDIAAAEPPAEVEPFAGSVDSGRAARTEMTRRLIEAQGMLEDAERHARGAADALAKYAADDRFEQVTSPVRRQIVQVDRDTLADYAEEWEKALQARLRVLSDDLAQIERHRTTIIRRLHGMVDQALGTLRAAQRLSKLPSGLGDWSGQDFLRIKFTDQDRAVLTESLGEIIDVAANTRGGPDKRDTKRDGIALLLKGVNAAMRPRGVRVEMLKPDAVLRTERVRVGEIGDVFSGGQLLTSAIILYCTMAALRANERGHVRRTHAGVLFLDNPIGRASAGYLLELQLKVAQTLGVQLVYTTGLFDTNALSVFPLIIRLRNDADLRAGLKYLSVESAIAKPLFDLPDEDGTGAITSTRVFTRPSASEAGIS